MTIFKLKVLFLLFFILIAFKLQSQELVEYDYELDAYYSNVSAFIDLDRERKITDGRNLTEAEIYKQLIKNSLKPDIFLVEAAIHPMPLLGLAYRNNHEKEYTPDKINQFNIVKAITTGFEEPYSLSFFLGRMMIFSKKEGDRVGKNRAYMGYLVSIGDYTIKDNRLEKDNWLNFEFKLKGTREKQHRDLDWSFRGGFRIHDNRDVANTLFIGARRSTIDYNKSGWSLIHNIAYTTFIAIDAETLHLNEAQLLLEKKWPIKGTKTSFGLEFGYIFTSDEKYRGQLRNDGVDTHQVVIRPNLKW